MPRSLFGRLLATAAVALLAALLFAGFAIGHVLERFVLHGLDDRLDAQIAVLACAVRPDGRLDRTRAIDLPPFDQPGSGWSWEIRAPDATLRSASLGGQDIVAAVGRPPRPDRDPAAAARPWPFEGRGTAGESIHGRILVVPTARGDAELLAAGPRAVVARPLRAAMQPLLLSLLLLGTGLALAILVQLRIGLRPLGKLRAMLGEVRTGKRDRVDAVEPSELLPLVEELNGLIAANRNALIQARGHVANLAHGLKTPLAALRLELNEQSPARLALHIDRIDAQIRHHLGRARAASPGGAGRAVTDLASHVADLVAALARIHADRPVRARIHIAEAVAVRCDPQDLDEMLGNLLDNGWRWAASEVRITAVREGRMVAIAIADDGPGISADMLAAAVEPGRRLDESGEGHGFGLSIARELAELYGGALLLANAPKSGLIATLRLPSAPG